MTFDAYETADGRPIEAYEFVLGSDIYRQTNAVVDQTIGGNTFTPLAALSRTEPTVNEELNSGEIQVTVPLTFNVATAFQGSLPSSLPSLTVYRKHLNDPDEGYLAVWKGDIVSCKFNENNATLTCQPITRVFDKQVPMRVYSATCNWQLYHRGCNVSRASYTATLPVTSVDVDGITVTITGLRTAAAGIDTTLVLGLTATELDHFWQRGVLSVGGTVGERRSVVETNVGGNPDVIRVNRPFYASSIAGVSADISAGCNHAIDQDCSRKFLNSVNYGGFHTVPSNNPFQIELNGGGIATSSAGSSSQSFAGGALFKKS